MIDDPLNRTKVARGSQLPQSKLTETDVELIREIIGERNQMKFVLSQMTNAKIAEKFEVHVRTIDRITAGESWTHI